MENSDVKGIFDPLNNSRVMKHGGQLKGSVS